MGILWPQTKKFCGLFPLKDGVYTYVVLHVLGSIASIQFFWSTYHHVLSHINDIQGDDKTEHRVTENDNILRGIMTGLVIGLTAYMVSRLLFVGVFIYGYWKSKATFVKIYLYCTVAVWTTEVFFNFIMMIFLNVFARLVLIVVILTNGYMLLVLRTVYLQMSEGKSRTITISSTTSLSVITIEANRENNIEHTVGETNDLQISNTANNIQISNTANNILHCRTCNCNAISEVRNGVTGFVITSGVSANRTDVVDLQT